MPSGFMGDFHSGLVVWLLLCQYLPLVFAGVAAARLRLQHGYRLAFAGAILVLLSSAWTTLEMAFMAILALTGSGQQAPTELGLLACLIALAGAVSGFVGAIKTLAVLSDPDVGRVFQAS
jgi:hypothetical protein